MSQKKQRIREKSEKICNMKDLFFHHFTLSFKTHSLLVGFRTWVFDYCYNVF